MTINESNGSVRNEQFGKTENTENENQTSADEHHLESAKPGDTSDSESSEEQPEKASPENITGDQETTGNNDPGVKEENTNVEEPPEPEEQDSTAAESDTESVIEEESAEEESKESEVAAESTENTEGDTDSVEETTSKEETEEEAEEDEQDESSETDDQKSSGGEPTPAKYEPEKIDYSKLSQEDLVKVLKDLVDPAQVNEIRKDIEAVKSSFYRKHKAEIDEKRKRFLSEGGQIQDFKVEESPLEIELKELLTKYKELRIEQSKKQEEVKEVNLKKKYDIIEGIKDLINSQESLNKTFHDFRELQNQWRDVGPVPQGNLKDLWESYHYHVEAFYDYIKINKELRDLDFKKNLEAKIKLCETAEELLLEPSVVEAFRRLQKLHDQWREIGPVPIEKRSELWERFKDATTKINRKHQEYFVNLKKEQKKNYEEKILLCEKAEKIAAEEIDESTDWEAKSKELIELQKIWKTIGFAPKKYNTQIYERFRKACDAFFDNKREHYSQNREEQQNNLQLKTELCIQAEALQDSTDWKKTTNELIALQKKWKSIGPVPRNQSDKIWKRFRAACDTFFNNKSEFYSKIDSHYEENLKQKQQLIEDIKSFELSSDVEKNLNTLKDFQRKWSDIGYVPIKVKNEIQEEYRKAINAKFDNLKVDEGKKAILKYRSRLENIQSKPNSDNRFRMERDKCFNKLKQLENDITLWENNIGFFANSDNAEAMIQDVNNKIEAAKKKMEQLKSKIRLLDEYED